MQPDSNHESIDTDGEKCFMALYGDDINKDTLTTLHYQLFIKSAKNRKVNLDRLPPTKDAASNHSYRTYYFLVQKWLGSNKTTTDWGWKIENEVPPLPPWIPPSESTTLDTLLINAKMMHEVMQLPQSLIKMFSTM